MIYGNKHVVFESVGVENTTYVWNVSTNVDNDNCYNNYDISDMRNTHLPSVLLKLSSVLQDLLTNTTIQNAKNGNGGILVSTSDKLFLPACKELGTSPSYSRIEENNALTTFNYYQIHSTQSDRIKYQPGTSTARSYWTRSPYSGFANIACVVSSNGSWYDLDAYNYCRISPCFAW